MYCTSIIHSAILYPRQQIKKLTCCARDYTPICKPSLLFSNFFWLGSLRRIGRVEDEIKSEEEWETLAWPLPRSWSWPFAWVCVCVPEWWPMRATVPAGGPVLIHKHFASTLRPPVLGKAILFRVIDTRDRLNLGLWECTYTFKYMKRIPIFASNRGGRLFKTHLWDYLKAFNVFLNA